MPSFDSASYLLQLVSYCHHSSSLLLLPVSLSLPFLFPSPGFLLAIFTIYSLATYHLVICQSLISWYLVIIILLLMCSPILLWKLGIAFTLDLYNPTVRGHSLSLTWSFPWFSPMIIFPWASKKQRNFVIHDVSLNIFREEHFLTFVYELYLYNSVIIFIYKLIAFLLTDLS